MPVRSKDSSSEKEIVQTLKRNDITDVQISLDYESIKADVSNNVKTIIKTTFLMHNIELVKKTFRSKQITVEKDGKRIHVAVLT